MVFIADIEMLRRVTCRCEGIFPILINGNVSISTRTPLFLELAGKNRIQVKSSLGLQYKHHSLFEWIFNPNQTYRKCSNNVIALGWWLSSLLALVHICGKSPCQTAVYKYKTLECNAISGYCITECVCVCVRVLFKVGFKLSFRNL